MKIEFLYFNGCPNQEPALKNLKEAIKDLGISAEITMIEVTDEKDAVNKRFLGSPSIRLDGMDSEGLQDNGEYSMNCRRYKIGSEVLGYPSKDMIKVALKFASG